MLNSEASVIHPSDEEVDLVLYRVAQSPTLTMELEELYDSPVLDEKVYLLDHYMIEKGLIKIDRSRRTITSKGLEISNFGGWLAYQRQLRTRQSPGISKSVLQYQLEIKSLKADLERCEAELASKNEKERRSAKLVKDLIEQNRNSRLATLLSGIVLGLVLSTILSFIIF